MNAPAAHQLALFDLDHTLIPFDSDHAWGQFTTALGWTDATEFAVRNDAFYAQYKAGTLDIAQYVRFATAAIVAQGEAKSIAAHADYMRDRVLKDLKPQALELVRAHQRAGHAVVIVTATNAFVTRPIAQAFGVDELIAIDLVRDPASGWYSGQIDGVASFREGKVARVQAWMQARGWSWADTETTFYSDSINDLPLLEQVTHPVATNPDARLRPIAQARGWRILDLFAAAHEPPRATFSEPS
jgi:HAD superfamily hydrolase (TIGR01490 family)